MKLQYLRRERTSYPGGGIWYVQFHPRASGYSTKIEAGRPESSVAQSEATGGRDVLASRRLSLRPVLVGSAGAVSCALVGTAYLLL